jgi:hypothetical protein
MKMFIAATLNGREQRSLYNKKGQIGFDFVGKYQQQDKQKINGKEQNAYALAA